MLYAVCGMFLPLFRKLSTRSILTAAGVFFLLPILFDALFGSRLADPLEAAEWRICALYGIPLGLLYTWSSMAGHPWGRVGRMLTYGKILPLTTSLKKG